MLASSSKVASRTCATEKINIVGSCSLFAVHPDTSSLIQLTFYVTSHEGSVVLSCATSLGSSLIQPHGKLDFALDSASLISSVTDHPMKRKLQKQSQVSKQSQSMFARKKHISTKSVSPEKYVNQCMIKGV